MTKSKRCLLDLLNQDLLHYFQRTKSEKKWPNRHILPNVDQLTLDCGHPSQECVSVLLKVLIVQSAKSLAEHDHKE